MTPTKMSLVHAFYYLHDVGIKPHMLFFFFKQKTAYEMRISDWSSDVCSSDLLSAQVISLALKDIPQDRVNKVDRQSELRDWDAPHPSLVVDRGILVQIGRASGRERVCQYV